MSRTPILKRCPQAKGIVTRVVTMSPKKPNSAIRHVAKVDLNNGLRLTARLPGKGYLCSKYNRVLVSGGRANDLPGVGYTAVRGVYDFSPVVGKKKDGLFMVLVAQVASPIIYVGVSENNEFIHYEIRMIIVKSFIPNNVS